MNKSGTRQHTSGRHRPNFGSQKTAASEPDMIIIPSRDGALAGNLRKLQYTAYEEISALSGDYYDEIAFQEYADDDPTRLRVVSRAQA